MDGQRRVETITFDQDGHLRRDTTVEALAKLRPVFKQNGTVTPGNASPLSDGAAGVIVMEAGTAARLGLAPVALGILAACTLWGLDNNFTRNISARNPLVIVTWK